MKCIRSNSAISETDYEITYLNNKVWIQKAALVLAVSVLEYNFTSRVDQIRFVNILCELDTGTIVEFPHSFNNVLIILESLRKLRYNVKLDFSTIYNTEGYEEMVNSYLNILVYNKEFEEALVIAEMENVPKDNILIEQFKNMALKRSDETFWKTCSDTFHKCNTAAETVIKFLLEFSQDVQNASYEQYLILKLAYEWAVQSSDVNIGEVEKQMWLCYTHLNVIDKCQAIEATTYKRPYSEMKNELEHVENVPDSYTDTNNFAESLCSAVSVLLNFNRYWEALKVTKMFSFKHGDLEILKLCSSIAEGLIQPSQFNKEQRLLVSDGGGCAYRSKTLWPSKISSISSGWYCRYASKSCLTSWFFLFAEYSTTSSVCTAHEVDPIDQLSKDKLVTLERLVEKLKSGADIGRNIFMMYRISVNIEIPYVVLLENDDDSKLLKDALDDNCRNKLEVVHDFITVYKWPKPKVIIFVIL